MTHAGACHGIVVKECREELLSAGWRRQFVKPADPQMMDASTEYDVWIRGREALHCIRNYHRGNPNGSMQCEQMKQVTDQRD
jgi:hypothetical protein